tara:strand:- start:1010 stop:1816 length:807 start_codon:yes stop_codon:yes gene_type:complete
MTEQIVYVDPLVASTYDPDGLIDLLAQDDIDWDDSSIWDIFSWAALPEVDESIAGPAWEDMTRTERLKWLKENRADLHEMWPNNPDFWDDNWTSLVGGDAADDEGDVATYYTNIRNQGAFGGTEIDYAYYQNNPMFQLAFANINWEFQDDLDAPDWDTPGEGVTQEHLQLGVEYIVETFQAIQDDSWREPWEGEIPDPITPVAMSTDYQTPFEIPGIVTPLAPPVMSQNLQKIRDRSGSNKEAEWKALKASTPNQQGFVDPQGQPTQD